MTSTHTNPNSPAENRPADDRSTETGAAQRQPKPGLVIAIGSVAVFFIALELTIISVAFPEISATFPDASRATLSWVFTAYNVGVAALLLIGGWLAERFGRRKLFLTGLAVFTIGSLASGLAPTIGLLIAARAAQAVGGALLIPASLALILHVVPDDKRDVAIGVWGAMAGLAAAVGPTVGAVLVASVGWRSVFLVNVPLAIVTAIVGARVLPESLDPNIARTVDLIAVPTGAIGVGLGVFIIVAAETLGWASPVTLGCAALAAACIGVFVYRSVRHPAPVFDPAVANDRGFAVGSVGSLAFVAGFTGWLVFAPSFLTEVWDYSVLRAGLAIAPGPVVMAIVSGPAGKMAAVRGHRAVITAGALTSFAAITWWLATIGDSPSYLTAMLPGLILMGAGVGAGFPMLTAASMVNVAPSQYAIGAAGSTTVRQLAMAVGIAIATAAVGSTSTLSSYRTSWIACGFMFAVTAVVIAALLPRHAGLTTVDLTQPSRVDPGQAATAVSPEGAHTNV